MVEDTPVYNQNIIDYIEIATTGNAVDFGDLTQITITCKDGLLTVMEVYNGNT